MSQAAVCPTCRKTAMPGPKWFPFCSERCQLVDLGKWLAEDFKISEPAGTSDAAPPAEERE